MTDNLSRNFRVGFRVVKRGGAQEGIVKAWPLMDGRDQSGTVNLKEAWTNGVGST